MAEPHPSPLVPALIGGVAAGVLSSVPFLSCFCCLWIIGGAIVSANLYAKNSPVTLTPGDGAIVGIFSGIAAAVAASLVNLAFLPANQEIARRIADQMGQLFPNMASDWDAAFRSASESASLAIFLFRLLIQAAVFAAFGALGGVIGASLYGKKTPPVQGRPPEPQV